MSERRIVQCRTCKADMVWVMTRRGKAMPLDPKPSEEGRFVYDGDTDDGKPRVAFLTEDQLKLHQGDRYTSHFATCPNSKQHRRP